MKRQVRFLQFFLVVMLCFSFCACRPFVSQDARALAEYLQWFDEPEKLPIIAFEKAEFDDEIMYYLDRGPYEEGDTESVKLIIVYNKSTGIYKNCFLLDMQYGLNPDVKEQWEARDKTSKNMHVFSEEEISAIAKEAAEYCKSK